VGEYVTFFQHHPVLVLAFFGLAGALVFTFFQGGGGRGVSRVGPLEATRLVNQEDGVVIDVRGDGEFRQGHVVNAVNLPLQHLPQQLAKVEKYRQRPVVTVCRSGQQSARAGGVLRRNGFEKVYTLSGGLQAWEAANLPLARK